MTVYEIEQEVINFHNTYENNAKKYGYETRKDTKELDLDSPNGRTMIATVFEILQPYTEKIEKLEEENERLEKGLKYAKRIEKDYKTKFDKVIEYIKEKYIEDYSNNDNYIPLEKLNLKNCNWERSLQVFDMLQGSDKE